MAIEAELKARVRDADHMHAVLRGWADEQLATYVDTYFDTPGGTLAAEDRELRVREVRTAEGTRSVLTYKGKAVDSASGSKPETETTIGDAAALREVLVALGFVVDIAFEKRCSNYRFERDNRPMLATVVQVPEVDGTFVEVETIVDEPDLSPALAAVRAVLADLGIDPEDQTTETYTDAVKASRDERVGGGRRSPPAHVAGDGRSPHVGNG